MGVVGVLLLMVDLSMVGVGEELKRTNKQNKTDARLKQMNPLDMMYYLVQCIYQTML